MDPWRKGFAHSSQGDKVRNIRKSWESGKISESVGKISPFATIPIHLIFEEDFSLSPHGLKLGALILGTGNCIFRMKVEKFFLLIRKVSPLLRKL